MAKASKDLRFLANFWKIAIGRIILADEPEQEPEFKTTIYSTNKCCAMCQTLFQKLSKQLYM